MLLTTDFNTHLYTEIINTISRDSDAVLETAIQASENEAKGYLGQYDIEELFNRTGANRDPVLLMYLKDMAVWHFIVVANPSVDIEYRRDRYKDAKDWLIRIQAGKVTPVGWNYANNATEPVSEIQVTSSPKRETHF